ncbi:DNA topoisomerase 4 subunit A [Bariatricus massiliensis]|uniref:DNA topoisomerase (ATP-hydrolyzing) n=1 Tax=Bariatricus massiliensis TaxID=1745713 RepID=A0ABS8DD75_9FIRM|nr:DNA topoisomerase (ATP-hydrolyzing) [Bariatricus massiliensis]MCB7303559.1 DNA topoisomerase 4 subunit A [Bariatricus massiliensis]MCB7373691.1 DNA topoisomerase 4 subunit A [Bariatricus massiliensis]MCB7386361.1 DNA topoisomerase 4 subunit A [Bariatricus massiliensis]MCB7410523.1 DNA topoisomerase 4 subunit A [Bariatricus massiliensis]MCQ5252193.1 DNA topoisomerase 4 subunit A [Bariatricus massiliensis]
MEDSQIIRTEYSDLMKKSYIDYAMSVIVARALPDVRDGLKPVQRRTLYDMYELGIRYDKPYRKCARIVGDTMGKYHPHGDSSIYEALVVMAQEFKKGMVLVDGHGNFGSIEGDGAAAMRYTEARLAKITQEAYLADLDKDIIDFVPNFDETEKEPAVLPVRLPNLLVNGAEGIAVGMATSIPTHNLGEVVDAVKAYMKNDEITTKQLMRYIKGPDFPTGGIVVNKDDLLNIYETGAGKIKIRGKVDVEELKGGKKRIVISEIPYTMIGAGIGKFLNDVCNLVESKKTNDIVDISNQSSKEGIRIVIDVKRDADVENLINMLYKKTRLEDTFGVNMLAVAEGRPETLGLKRIIEHHVDFQFELATRKYNTLLKKELDRKEIQEGLIKACDVIDLIIEILRGSTSVKDAKVCLVSGITDNIKFKSKISQKMASMLRFTERQASAILEMRLYKLIGLEIEALQKEHEETLANITKYEDILNNYDSMADVIIADLDAIKKEFAVKRKTVIENAEEAVFEEKKIEEQEVVFLMDRFGYAKTVDVAVYERNKEAADQENKYIVHCMNTGKLCLFTADGKMHQVKVLDLPYGKFRDKGQPIDNVSNYDSTKEEIVFLCDDRQLFYTKFLFTTKQGMIKKVEGSEFQVSKRTIAATKLQPEDALASVCIVNDSQNVVLMTAGGYALRFTAEEVSDKKKGAVGVRGIRLQKKDEVEAVFVFEEGTEQKVVFHEKEITLNRLKLAKRDGAGTKIRK